MQSVFSSCFSSKGTSCFKNGFYTVVSPVDLFWIAFSRNFNDLPLTSNPPSLTSTSTVETTLSCIVFQQVCKHSIGSVRSLMRVTSNTFLRLDTTEARRPIRPKPLLPNFATIRDFLLMKIKIFCEKE